jgi:AcrR family transcriptional regulator
MSKAMENYLRKRKIIVNSAKNLFLGKGFTATSMDKVAQKTGITKQTIYRYFPSKMDLFKATLEAAARNDKKDYVFGDRDIKIELFDFGKIFLRFHMKKERLNIIRLIVAEGRKDKELSRIFYETRQKIHGFGILIPYLKKQIPQTNDTEFLVKLFFEMLLSIRMPVLLGIQSIPSEDEMALHVNKVVEFFLAGCKFSMLKDK